MVFYSAKMKGVAVKTNIVFGTVLSFFWINLVAKFTGSFYIGAIS